MSPTAKAGCLIILNSDGQVVETLNSADGINGPWDLDAVDRGADSDVFVTNVLNGTVAADGAVVNRGTVVRLVLHTGRQYACHGWSRARSSAPASRSEPTPPPSWSDRLVTP